jgi:Family of unknown function (DUF6069)
MSIQDLGARTLGNASLISGRPAAPAAQDHDAPKKASLLRGGALGVALASAASLLVYGMGKAAGGIRVIEGSSPVPTDLSATAVIVTCAVTVVLGTALLGLLERRWPRAWRVWVPTAAVVAVLSALPLWGLEIDTASKVCLTAMHLATGLAAIAGHHLARGGHRA